MSFVIVGRPKNWLVSNWGVCLSC